MTVAGTVTVTRAGTPAERDTDIIPHVDHDLTVQNFNGVTVCASHGDLPVRGLRVGPDRLEAAGLA